MPWPAEHVAAFQGLLDDLDLVSFAAIANAMSEATGTRYTRNSCIGKARRMGISRPAGVVMHITQEQRNKRRAARKRQERWAAQPSLQARYERMKQQKAVRARFASNGMAKTAPAYRRHQPRLPDMTKNELRRMLALAVRNTAAIELRPE